jgi:molybdopterin converting factor subunit 1
MKHHHGRFSDSKPDGPIPGSHILTLVPEATAQICVHVRLFASYREAARTSRLDSPLPAGARVSDLVQALAASIPSLLTTRGLIAVNHTYVDSAYTLSDGDEVALIPPVSGGS